MFLLIIFFLLYMRRTGLINRSLLLLVLAEFLFYTTVPGNENSSPFMSSIFVCGSDNVVAEIGPSVFSFTWFAFLYSAFNSYSLLDNSSCLLINECLPNFL